MAKEVCEMTEAGTRKIEAPVSWKDVFFLNIPDSNLRGRVEGFLNFLESTAFRFDQMDPGTGIITASEFSGQDMIASCADLRDLAIQNDTARIVLKDGKYEIASHDNPYRTHFDGSATVFANINGNAGPVKILLGRDYLRGSQYQTSEGHYQPVTVDGVMAHELAHFAFMTQDESLCMQIEDIIVGAMGGALRGGNYEIRHEKGSNRGYHSLHHKVVRSELNDAFTAGAEGAEPATLAAAAPAAGASLPARKPA